MLAIVAGDFEWDSDKAEANAKKHGVTFEEATTAFEDPCHAVVADGADGYLLIGFSHGGRLLTVVHVQRGARIVSAWRATATEERIYRNG